MRLKLAIPQRNESWTLKPGKNYTVGSSPECEIVLPPDSGLSARHMTLSYDEPHHVWRVQDVSDGGGMYINNELAQDYPIEHRLKIDLAHRVNCEVNLEGEVNSAPPQTIPQPPLTIPNAPTQFPSTYNQHPPEMPIYVQNQLNHQKYGSSPSYRPQQFQPKPQLSSLPIFHWRDFVQSQVARKQNGPDKFSTWFSMTTGFRKTPWVKAFSDRDDERSNFNDFEGYVIPNFQGSVNDVITAVEKELGTVGRYHDTYCYVAKLTDAHIIDSAKQSFLGIELFPKHRSDALFSTGDYRRFCVVSYHHVRTYLLVEQYGSDLFVSWITRYEPPTSWIPMFLWAGVIFSIMIMSSLATSVNLMIGILVGVLIWCNFYGFPALAMEKLGISPKAANARLFMLFSFLLSFLFPIPHLLLVLLPSRRQS
jgi:hypothetical protein